MNLKETYNKIAERWHRDHQSDDWWVLGTDKFISLLPGGATVLDIGCGAGTKSKYFFSKGLKVAGFDFSEKQIEIAKKEAPQVRFQVLDVYDLDTVNESFDGVFAQAVLLHIPKKDISIIFDKLSQKVKAGGYLYVAVKEMKQGGQEEEVKQENDYGYMYERFFSYFTADEVEEYFRNIGFEITYSVRESFEKTTWIQVIGRKK